MFNIEVKKESEKENNPSKIPKSPSQQPGYENPAPEKTPNREDNPQNPDKE